MPRFPYALVASLMPEPRYRDAFAARTRLDAVSCPVRAARHVLRWHPEARAALEARLVDLGVREGAVAP